MSKENPWYRMPAPDLTSFARPGKRIEVTYPVSYRYNGGTVINDEWFAGFEVPAPVVPPGYKLVDIGVGLQLNAHPPYATKLLVPVSQGAYS